MQTERYLVKRKILTQQQLQEIRSEIEAEVKQAAEEADRAPQPDPAIATLHIYDTPGPFFEEKPPRYLSDQSVSMIDAINHGCTKKPSATRRSSCGARTSPIPKAAFSA